MAYRSISEYKGLGRTSTGNFLKKSNSFTDKSQVINYASFIDKKKTKHKHVPGKQISSLYERFRKFLSIGPINFAISFLFERFMALFKRRADYFTYYDEEYNGHAYNGIYDIEDEGEISVGVAGDWGSDTIDACAVTEVMEKHSPDYTIHIGDIYYVGEENEVKDSFQDWCYGSKGSFALMGNHERMSGAHDYYKLIQNKYYDELKNKFGIYTGSKFINQHSSFFCLNTSKWRILGLDTGYKDSLQRIFGNGHLGLFGPGNCDFQDEMLQWLKNEVKPGEDNRGLIVLTHHQYYSKFKGESDYFKPARQLQEIIGNIDGKKRKIIWLWGHEHKFSVYGGYECDGGVLAYGRCIGHGGMPIDINNKNFTVDANKDRPLILFDKRLNNMSRYHIKERLGYNGFAFIFIKDDKVKIEYRDINNNLLLSEIWKVFPDGDLQGDIALSCTEPGFIVYDKEGIRNAVNYNNEITY